MPKKRRRPATPSPGQAQMAAGERLRASGPRAKAEVTESAAAEAPHAGRSSLVIVGIGASAGGLDATAEDRENMAAAGFDDYVAKPAEPAELLSKLEGFGATDGTLLILVR